MDPWRKFKHKESKRMVLGWMAKEEHYKGGSI